MLNQQYYFDTFLNNCKGLAQALIEEAVSYARKANCRAIYLHVITSNEAAIAFYEKVTTTT
jgi:ribosomal protein S18 acetylase RimI-like enzyme